MNRGMSKTRAKHAGAQEFMPSNLLAGDGAEVKDESAPARREVILGGVAAAMAGFCCGEAAAQSGDAAARARPEPGDQLILAEAEKEPKPLAPGDLAVNGEQVLAWAMQPGSGTVRNGSRLNQVLLIRLDPAELDEATRKRAADGVVAYSAICTHQQCPVTEWKPEKNALHCACHGSEFDPRRSGQVVNGPAIRPLAALPVRVENGLLVVGGRFVGRVGAPQPG